MLRFILLSLSLISILSQAMAQKITEEQLIDYEWICLNRGLTDENLLDTDTLILLQNSDWEESYSDEEEESEPIATINTSNCFNFVFENTPHKLSVYQIDHKNASIKTATYEVDSLLFQQLEKDSLIQLKASIDFLSSLDFGFEGRKIKVVNSKNPESYFYIRMTANNWSRFYPKHGIFITVIESFYDATWEFDRKKKESTIVS